MLSVKIVVDSRLFLVSYGQWRLSMGSVTHAAQASLAGLIGLFRSSSAAGELGGRELDGLN